MSTNNIQAIPATIPLATKAMEGGAASTAPSAREIATEQAKIEIIVGRYTYAFREGTYVRQYGNDVTPCDPPASIRKVFEGVAYLMVAYRSTPATHAARRDAIIRQIKMLVNHQPEYTDHGSTLLVGHDGISRAILNLSNHVPAPPPPAPKQISHFPGFTCGEKILSADDLAAVTQGTPSPRLAPQDVWQGRVQFIKEPRGTIEEWESEYEETGVWQEGHRLGVVEGGLQYRRMYRLSGEQIAVLYNPPTSFEAIRALGDPLGAKHGNVFSTQAGISLSTLENNISEMRDYLHHFYSSIDLETGEGSFYPNVHEGFLEKINNLLLSPTALNEDKPKIMRSYCFFDAEGEGVGYVEDLPFDQFATLVDEGVLAKVFHPLEREYAEVRGNDYMVRVFFNNAQQPIAFAHGDFNLLVADDGTLLYEADPLPRLDGE